MPTLREQHADIMQETAADLVRYAARRAEPMLIEEWVRISFRILRRRVADLYRSEVHQWAQDESALGDLVADGSSDPEALAHFAGLLQQITKLLAGLREEDQNLLMRTLIPEGGEDLESLSTADRKRLSRLRVDLRTQMEWHKDKADPQP